MLGKRYCNRLLSLGTIPILIEGNICQSIRPVARQFFSQTTAVRGKGDTIGLEFFRGFKRRNLQFSQFINTRNLKQYYHTNNSYTQLASSIRFYSTKMSNVTKNEEREVLPTNVKPLHYHITLEPNFKTFKFDGDEAIDIKVVEDSNYISINTLEIEFGEVSLTTGTGDIIKPVSTNEDKTKQVITFKFPDSILKKGDIVSLHIKFVGLLNDKMAGFYRSSYEEDGVKKYFATTQMEATDCRRAFPSFDEPNLKAKFSINLIGDKNFTYLSNMDIAKEESIGDDRKKVIFNTTPLMSTYLVAFIVGDLRSVESNYKFRDIPVKVYTTPGYEKQGQFSAELAAHDLEYYEKVFGIKYPLPKMDLVAIHDFTAGAMENWGLVTFRMVDILFDESKSTLSTRFRIAEVVAHELAHQWFGNYCTLDFWDSLWLNESFATYMSWKCCNHFHPEWKVWENFVGESFQYALSLDSLRSSHAIEVPVKRADEINQIFDAISYEKGSSVLRMLANWLGEDDFIKGVSLYLKRHAYSNARTEALWKALSEVSGKDVQGTMKVWTEKVGYPLLTVKETSSGVNVEQHRFLRTGDVKAEDDTTIYPVFVGLSTDNGIDESIVLDKRSMELPVKTTDDFFKINANSNGVYRVNYQPERWAKLGKSASKLSVEDRIGLVADAGALATPGYSKTTNVLSLVSTWKDESSYFVWDAITSQMGSMRSAWLFESKDVNNAIKGVLRNLVSGKLQELGWELHDGESFLEQRLKTLLFGTATYNGDAKAVAAAKKMFAAYIAGDKDAINPNLRGSVYGTIAANGGEKEFEQLLAIYKHPQSEDEKNLVLRMLGRFQDRAILKKVLTLLLDGTVRSQDIYLPLAGMRNSTIGITTEYEWMKENWDTLYKILPPGLSMLGSVVQICTSGFTKDSQYKEVESFFKDKDTKGYDQGLAQSLETIKSKAAWVSRDSADVESWLKAHGYMN